MNPANWGATHDEVADAFACDALPFEADAVFHRAVDVAAPPELAYRWLCQLRVAPYSYDLLDNFGRPSPKRLRPGLEELAIGQRMMTIFRLVAFTRGEDMTVALGLRSAAGVMGDFAGTYRVRPAANGCRLVARVLVRYPGGPYGRLLRALMPWGDLIMFRKQLLTLKRYAERDARQSATVP